MANVDEPLLLSIKYDDGDEEAITYNLTQKELENILVPDDPRYYGVLAASTSKQRNFRSPASPLRLAAQAKLRESKSRREAPHEAKSETETGTFRLPSLSLDFSSTSIGWGLSSNQDSTTGTRL